MFEKLTKYSMVEKLKAFPPRSGATQRCLLSTLSFNIGLGKAISKKK
jgi:hypothetical protein